MIKIVAKLFANAEIVTTPDLLDYASGAVFIPVALQRNPSHNIPKEKNEKVVIIHAPTNRVKKGTPYIIEQVKKLQNKDIF